ncbi:MAG: Nramp family divalent metal transporter [Planctomycetota bacterium]
MSTKPAGHAAESPAERSAERPPRWRPGPGLLVTAAFIGPGTVTTASLAGANYGFALLWAVVLSTAAAVVVQEMAARTGLIARRGLAEAIREAAPTPWARRTAMALVLTAIVLGNTAYQTSNLIGAGTGLEVLTGLGARPCAALLGVAVTAVLAAGQISRRLRSVLIAVVLAMSVAFLVTAAMAGPDAEDVARGALAFRLPAGATLTVLALLGTTVVPYNLFLHATAVQQRWPAEAHPGPQLAAARLDTLLAVGLGGGVTVAILATAAAAFYGQATPPASVGQLALQLEPLLGPAGRSLFAAGLAAAGLTSALTAPLAAGYVAAGALPGPSGRTARGATIAVAGIGALLAGTLGGTPRQIIVVAQAANGLLLPLVVAFLLVAVNRRSLLGRHRNGVVLNVLGGLVLLLAVGLGGRQLIALLAG